MRLLHFNDAGDLCLTRDLYGKKIPQYAILSHVWGDDEDEISFTDMIEGADREKPGYVKIKSCGQQAEQDGIQYFWVDTCCIDKRSSAELSEAINSMFDWYEKAKVCYAYLSDIPHSQDWLPAFRRSRWFSRGWTLQELLAPREVRFFDQEWHAIGDRSVLAAEIEAIAGIPKQVFDSTDSMRLRLRRFSIAQRMSWAAKRKTTRVEDTAYCLMGIFDVNMPLLYGEGKKSFLRLQEEIMKVSNDETIFTWHCCYDYIEEGFNTLLAPHPACFAMCNDVVVSKYAGPRNLLSESSDISQSVPSPLKWKDNLEEVRLPFMMTNRGLQISTRLYSMPDLQDRNSGVMLLNCRRLRPDYGLMALVVWNLGRGYSVQYCTELPKEIFADRELPPLETIYLLRLRV